MWFEVAWQMVSSKNGVSAAHLYRVLPVGSYQTVWAMLSRLRSVMGWSDSQPLAGRVEVDETYLGGPREGTAGRGAAGKTLVAGAIEVGERGWGRCRLMVIPDASKTSLRHFVTTTVKAGSTVVTDGWSAYPPALSGYLHEPINVSASNGPAHQALPAVHRLFALVDHFLAGAYHGSWSVGHLPSYLDEFAFRFNRRHAHYRGLLLLRLLQRVVNAPPAPYKSLVQDPSRNTNHPKGVPGPRALPGTLQPDSHPRPWRR